MSASPSRLASRSENTNFDLPRCVAVAEGKSKEYMTFTRRTGRLDRDVATIHVEDSNGGVYKPSSLKRLLRLNALHVDLMKLNEIRITDLGQLWNA